MKVKMIFNYIALTLIFLCSACGYQKKQMDIELLNNIKTGKFIYKNEYEQIIVERDQNNQIEYSKDSTLRIYFQIIWNSPSQYDMIFNGGSIGCLNIGDTIKVDIVSCSEEGYKYIADGGRCGGKTRGELLKIK